MLTISRLGHRSIKYYNDTAKQAKNAATKRQSPGGGLAEYYSEGETRIPSWLVVGDKHAIGPADRTRRLSARRRRRRHRHRPEPGSMTAEPPTAPPDASFTDKSVHGFDLTFAAPKSVSLIRALTDDVAEKVLATAHTKAVHAAMEYLHRHAGYTRVHNPITGNKDLQRLPGLVAIAYQHETSRCGDPHLHTHVIVPNRQPRRDGQLVIHRLQKPAPRGQSRRHHLPSHPATPPARRARLRVQPRRPAHRDGRNRRRRPAKHQSLVATLHPAARMGAQQPRRRRRRTHRRAAGRRAEGHPPRQTRVAVMGGPQSSNGAPTRAA